MTATQLLWEIAEKKHIPNITLIGASPQVILSEAFSDISYNGNYLAQIIPPGMTLVSTLTDIEIDKANPLTIAAKVMDNVGGEFYADNFNFALVRSLGRQTGIEFRLDLNLKSISRAEETTKLVTRLYPYGRDGMEIGVVNGGRDYIDSPLINDYPYVHEGEMTFNDISDPNILLQRAWREFSEDNYNRIDKPKITYRANVIDLWKLADFGEAQKPGIGDYVTVYDKSLGINSRTRVAEYEYYPYEPQSGTITLGNPPKTILDILTDVSRSKEYYEYEPPPEVNIENIINEITNEGDQFFNEITEVTVQNVVVAENAMLLNCWVRYLMVEAIQTNFTQLLEGGTRNYIKIQDQYIRFLTAPNDGDGMVNYTLPNGEQIFWTAIGENVQAYMYFTTTPPESVYPVNGVVGQYGGRGRSELTAADIADLREQFAVKIHSNTTDELTKAEIGFNEDATAIVFTLGAGDGTGENNGVGRIYKDADGLRVIYNKRSTGEERSFSLTDDGITFTPQISAGHVTIDHAPTQEDIDALEDGTVVLQYDPQNIYVPSA
ncbi:hypothetical protein FACS189490_11650 [Clostridia bacterium]|nr:hypothetical protein FACS189490_11650 [Clostridia bacterium]